jgi:UrcA family protein
MTAILPCTRSVMFGIAAGTATALMLFATQRACADSDVTPPSETVHYSAQDLATSSGTRALYVRLASAARAVCPKAETGDLATFKASRRCQHQAMSRAVQTIDATQLTQMLAATGSQSESSRRSFR